MKHNNMKDGAKVKKTNIKYFVGFHAQSFIYELICMYEAVIFSYYSRTIIRTYLFIETTALLKKGLVIIYCNHFFY